ncbi:hypothetical protein G7Y79_00021g050600 [Physcia stellaris]|nr:hypothetical protein G7Y79_00021g050600 [Physcia stellaris]
MYVTACPTLKTNKFFAIGIASPMIVAIDGLLGDRVTPVTREYITRHPSIHAYDEIIVHGGNDLICGAQPLQDLCSRRGSGNWRCGVCRRRERRKQ